MTARFKEALPTINEEGEILFCDLEDFPHGKLLGTKEGEKGPIEFYEPLPGTKVISYDHNTRKLAWMPVTCWSKHLDREIEVVTLRSGKQIITDDDPRAIYGVEAGSLQMSRNTPTMAIEKKMIIPVARKLERVEFDESIKEHKGIKLDFKFGYLIGCLVSNGWVESLNGNTTGEFILLYSTKM